MQNPARHAKLRSRGYLPHLEAPNAIYSVTFRLMDSIPQSVLDEYLRDRQNILDTAHQQNRPLSPSEIYRLNELFSQRIEDYLDLGHGKCCLADPRAAKIVFDAMLFFNSKRYKLFASCVMPNHAHALFQPMPGNSLAEILHSWKSFSAKEINRALNLTGDFWMPEYYDHLIRDESDFSHALLYIVNNPKKANLKDWPWVHQ